jgi:simple sugar transport system substrate-binding protein
MSALVTRRSLLGSAAAAATFAGLDSRPGAQAPLRAGFVYVGPVGDHGWTYGQDVARRELEAALGDQVETSFVENV